MRKKMGHGNISQLLNLIESVITVLMTDIHNPRVPCRPGLGTKSVADNMPYRCRKMMYIDSGYARLAWDRLMEALIDPENREACGRIVSEPGREV